MAVLVKRDEKEGVVTLTLNRPEVLNALNPALFLELRDHVEDIAIKTGTIGCVIITGAGRSFSAGNDLNAIKADEKRPDPFFPAETINRIASLPQAVIVAVTGHCYTGGLELALAGDLLIATESSKFADTHGKWGMTPLWGMSQRLPRRVGILKAKEMMFTGRVVNGKEAVKIGLANACVKDDELLQKVKTMAQSIVKNSWHTLRADKMLVDGGLGREMEAALAFERSNSPGRADDFQKRINDFS